MSRYLKELLQIGGTVVRMISFNLGLLIIIHIIACLWIVISKYDLIGSWLDNDGI